MKRIDPYNIPNPAVHQYLLGAIGPRPIAFASTVDKDGNPNLSPFSFFNAFGVNPTTLIFSPSRRGRDNTTKHTYENLKEVPEVVINVVTFAMVEQTSLSSTEYPRGVNEFVKAGFTPLPSETIKPFSVKESPVQFECKVRDIIETGTGGGAANLVVCEVSLIHVDESVLDEDGKIDQHKIDLVGRMGGNFYSRSSLGLFEVEKPLQKLGIGIDNLPEKIRFSDQLTGNELGKLGNIESLPSVEEAEAYATTNTAVAGLIGKTNVLNTAKELLSAGKTKEALMLLMARF